MTLFDLIDGKYGFVWAICGAPGNAHNSPTFRPPTYVNISQKKKWYQGDHKLLVCGDSATYYLWCGIPNAYMELSSHMGMKFFHKMLF